MTKTPNSLQNELCGITFDPNRYQIFSGSDYTDHHNDPCFYSKSKRGVKKAWEILQERFNDKTTMYDAANILGDNKIKIHSYCSID